MFEFNRLETNQKAIVIGGIIGILSIIGVVGVANIFYGIHVIVQVILQLITILTNLIAILTNLLYVIAILMIPISGLFVAALFTCPSQDTFTPWLKSFISFSVSKQQTQQTTKTTKTTETTETTKTTETTETTSLTKYVWKSVTNLTNKYIVEPLFPTMLSTFMFKDQQFLFVGCCRIATCISNDGNVMTFVGVFNT